MSAELRPMRVTYRNQPLTLTRLEYEELHALAYDDPQEADRRAREYLQRERAAALSAQSERAEVER